MYRDKQMSAPGITRAAVSWSIVANFVGAGVSGPSAPIRCNTWAPSRDRRSWVSRPQIWMPSVRIAATSLDDPNADCAWVAVLKATPAQMAKTAKQIRRIALNFRFNDGFCGFCRSGVGAASMAVSIFPIPTFR